MTPPGPAKRPNRGPFSRVPNLLAEALARTDLTAREHRVVWVFVREVLGWRDRRETNRVAIGRSRLEALTGIDRGNLRGTIDQLIERGILRVAAPENAQNGTPTDYIFVTNPKAWKAVVTPKTPRRGGGHANPTPLGLTPTPGVDANPTPGVDANPTNGSQPLVPHRIAAWKERERKEVLPQTDTPPTGSPPRGVLPTNYEEAS